MAGIRGLVIAAVLCAAVLTVHANRNARIVGGTPHDIERAPWLVQIVYYNPENSKQMLWNSCAGVIVDERHILTAAHCFEAGSKHEKDPINYLGILAGSTTKNWSGNHDGKIYRIKSVKRNPAYKKRGGFLWLEEKTNDKNDIAVLETAEPIKFDAEVRAIQVTKAANKPLGGTTVYVGGWGVSALERSKDDYKSDFHPGMHIATGSVMNDLTCHQYLDKFRMEPASKRSLICVQNIDGNSCQGDSGSGLWIEPEGQAPVLVGLVQSGASCHLSSHGLFVDLTDDDVRKFLRKNKIAV